MENLCKKILPQQTTAALQGREQKTVRNRKKDKEKDK